MAEPAKKSLLRRVLAAVLAPILALWLFLEEWLWDLMHLAMTWLGKLPPVRWLEARIASLPPWAALIAFVIPGAVLLPLKVVAVWLITHHHKVMGLQVFVIAKVVGTALLAWIFALTKPRLMTIGWFARAYHAFQAWKERLFAFVKEMPLYRRVRAVLRVIKAKFRAWWRSRRA